MTTVTLADLHRYGARGFVALFWVHTIAVAVIATYTNQPMLVPAALAVIAAAAYTAAWLRDPIAASTRFLAAAVMVGQISLMVMAASGRYQIDLHMYYFAGLAMLAVFCDWRLILLAAGLTAVHHLSFNFLLPYAVFPDGSDVGRVLLHAAIVILETVVLVFLTRFLANALATATAMLTEARHAQAEAERSTEERQAVQRQAAADRSALLQRIAGDLETGLDQRLATVGDAVATMRASATAMSTNTTDVTARAQEVSQAADRLGGDMTLLTQAAEELSRSISAITGQMDSSANLSEQAVAEADGARQRVAGLEDAAAKIGEIVTLISSIAEETNLLALNATIEAARAGEAGKGFAVVAAEVKTLATQTAGATEEITRQVQAIQQSTGDTVAVIRRIGTVIDRINQTALEIAQSVREQESTTAGIAATVAEAAGGGAEVTKAIGTVAGSTAEIDAAAGTVRDNSTAVEKDLAAASQAVRSLAAELRAAA